MADIALVTDHRYESPREISPYVANVLEEDRLLSEALARHGLTTQRVDWARAGVDWSGFGCALLRTPWDYFDRFAEFESWLREVSSATRLCNEPSTVRWNIDKHYLADLERAGVSIVPTEFLERGDPRQLAEVLAARGWNEAVVKPAVSASARHTYRVRTDDVAQRQPIVAELLHREAMIVQPFVPDVVARGEVALVMIDGDCTHAVLKRPKPGDFRVQDDHGGTIHEHQPSAAELDLAHRAMAVCDPHPIYGRVDVVRDARGEPMVIEVELVEPELWFRTCPAAAERLADALANWL